MTKSKEIFNEMDADELKLMLLCFAKPRIMEAMRIYNTMPPHSRDAFYNAGAEAILKHYPDLQIDPDNNPDLKLIQG